MLLATLVQMVVQGVMGLGMMRVAFDVLEGGGVDIGRLFSQWTKAWRYVVTMLLVVVVLVLPLMLLFFVLAFVGAVAGGVSVADMLAGGEAVRSKATVLPGVILGAGFVSFVPLLYFSVPLYLLQAELTFNDDVTPVQALRNCYALARGERLSIVGVLLISAVVGFVGLLACCVGLLPALALGQLLLAGLYLSLRNGSERE
jgi:hypothetical protein